MRWPGIVAMFAQVVIYGGRKPNLLKITVEALIVTKILGSAPLLVIAASPAGNGVQPLVSRWLAALRMYAPYLETGAAPPPTSASLADAR